MKIGELLGSLRELLTEAERIPLDQESKIVILSDLHLGDGSASDDFLRNERAVLDVLRSWYLPKGYLLVLNGDVEDLLKAPYQKILEAHEEFFLLLDEFGKRGLLRKIVGNHDLKLLLKKNLRYPIRHALRLEWRGRTLLVYHGHQASRLFVKHNYISHFVVRYLAHPLRIKNADIPMTSKRRFSAERRLYRASRKLRIVSLTGHTHRPLFESLSKYDTLRFKVEGLLRRYVGVTEEEKPGLVELISIYSAELGRLTGKQKKRRSRSLYETEDAVLPCLFNSGCVTGSKGFTGLEIEGGSISLVHWTRSANSRSYVEREALRRDELAGTPWIRYVLNQDKLDYVVARTELL